MKTCLLLFFVTDSVKTVSVWKVADYGSARNQYSEAYLLRLLFQPLVRKIGDVQAVGSNRIAFDLLGFIVLPITSGSVVLWHEFGVVSDFPIK